jgi:hypothetical protein
MAHCNLLDDFGTLTTHTAGTRKRCLEGTKALVTQAPRKPGVVLRPCETITFWRVTFGRAVLKEDVREPADNASVSVIF